MECPVSRTKNLSVRPAALVLAVSALLLGASRVADAHDVLVSSTPGKGATIASGPSRVDLVFNEPVDSGPDEITVTGPDGSSRWDTGATTVTGETVSVGLRTLGPAGSYTVGYHIVSADGHPVSDSFTFTLSVAGSGTPATADAAVPAVSTASTGSSGGTVPVWIWIAGAVVLLAAGAVVARRIAR
jgi:methionine-rich copper-binding protein CopC